MTVHQPRPHVRETGRPSRTSFGDMLRRALHRDALQVSTCRPLSTDVYRLTLTTGQPASVVVKRLDPAAAHRDRLLVRRWLPAVGLAQVGPPLLATICDQGDHGSWSVYEWLDGPFPDSAVGRLADVVASLHVRCADHPMLAEVRHHGAYLGWGAYVGQLNDAMLALAAVRRDPGARAHLAEVTLTDLERAVALAQEQAPALLSLLHRVGGPDTVLHGDLWPCNVLAGPGWLRLIDWDRLGVGPAIYDVSTLLLRLPLASRRQLLDRYLSQIAAAGWPLPTVDEVVFLSTALEHARLATLISWRVLDLLRAPAGTVASWAGRELQSIRTWWHQVDPRPEEKETVLR